MLIFSSTIFSCPGLALGPGPPRGGNNYSLYFILSTPILLSMLLVSIEPSSATNSSRSIRAWIPEPKLQQEYFRLKLNSHAY